MVGSKSIATFVGGRGVPAAAADVASRPLPEGPRELLDGGRRLQGHQKRYFMHPNGFW